MCKDKLSFFSFQILKFAAVELCMLAIAFVYRASILFAYGNFGELNAYRYDILKSFIVGARFDMMVITYFLFLLILLALLTFAWWWRTIFVKISRIWSCIAVVLFSILLTCDFFYYRFFEAHFNLLIFGLVDDETQSILKSIWTDFPVIRIVLFLVLLSLLLCYIVKRIYRSAFLYRLSKGRISVYLFVAIIPLSLFLMRGRLGMFPLRAEDGFHSKNQFLNQVSMNGIFLLKDAWTYYHKNKLDPDIDKMLTEAGFASDRELVSKYLNIPIDSITADPLSYLIKTTDKDTFLVQNPPHVIIIQTEGMGLNYMNLQSASFQILGALEDELSHCIVFKNFMPYSGTTIHSLEGILTNSVLAPISLTNFYNTLILSSGLTPFKQAGYATSFVTGTKKAWRNLDVYIPAQGFDMYESRENIVHDVPGATENEWGAYDEFMFRQIRNKLDTVSRPQLIVAMSITNHSPYLPPPGYNAANIPVSADLKAKLANSDESFLKSFITFQYACNCLASFIRTIRNSDLADQTIIVITGDHSIKGIVPSSDNDMLGKHGVPLIMYVPERYLKNKTVDVTRWGSHKDIFPTVLNLALSEAHYYYLGNDLFSADLPNSFAIHPGVAALCNTGAISMESNQMYQWDEHTKLPVPVDDDANLQKFRQKVHVWKTVSKYVTLRSLNQSSNIKSL